MALRLKATIPFYEVVERLLCNNVMVQIHRKHGGTTVVDLYLSGDNGELAQICYIPVDVDGITWNIPFEDTNDNANLYSILRNIIQ
jgi:hypothetical protein